MLASKMENIKQTVGIDIATGDPVTPGPIVYQITRLLSEKTIKLNGYNLETILSEKVETILSRGLANSRMKDFYDVFIIYKLKENVIDWEVFKKSFANTCEYRHFHMTKEEAEKLVPLLEKDAVMKKRWDKYSKKNSFASNVSFANCIQVMLTLINDKAY